MARDEQIERETGRERGIDRYMARDEQIEREREWDTQIHGQR